jgi:hypothetical protein
MDTNTNRKRVCAVALCALGILGAARVSSAQVQMPDPKQMSGIPRPVDDLPMGSISVRLIRGSLTNNITKYPVEMHIGSKVLTVQTDENGRAQFDHLSPASTVKAVAVVDGEQLESQEFQVPDRGGIRLMLVATDKEKAAQEAAAASQPAVVGQVVLGEDSRVVVEPGDETLEVYYLLTITNPASTPVKTAAPFTFAMPTGANGTTVLPGSSTQARADGAHIYVDGAFPPGNTSLQVACTLPVYSDTVEISQVFPATFQQLAVIARKQGDIKLTSPQLTRQQDMPTNGEVAIVGEGGTIPAGQPITLTFSGLPHHSSAPRYASLGLAFGIALIGVWAASRPGDAAKTDKQQVVAKRERLFQELVRLENDRRNNRGERSRYTERREALVASLEQLYGSLDTDEAIPS